VRKTKGNKGAKLMAMADDAGSPITVHTTSASLHEVSLVADAILESFVDEFPEPLIGDNDHERWTIWGPRAWPARPVIQLQPIFFTIFLSISI
jgi:hypothetical protein